MAEAAAKEPSMEDILSSIRQIIAEEGGDEPVERAVPAADMGKLRPTISDNPDARLEEPDLGTPNMEPPPAATPSSSGGGVSAASVSENLKSAPPQYTTPDVPAPDSIQSGKQETRSDTKAVAMADATLPSETVVQAGAADPRSTETPISKNEAILTHEEAFRGALMSPSADNAVLGSFDRLKRSAMDDVEARTEAILRPLLREWLDENLPILVERLVREEIERVARG